MIDKIGIIGVGHLASYLVEGFKNSGHEMEIYLSPRNQKVSKTLAKKFEVNVASNNQEVVNNAHLLILSTQPKDVIDVGKSLKFRREHTVVSVAAGVLLDTLKPVVTPATTVRALPLSCAAINKSPTLIYPDHSQVHSLFSLLGDVHLVPNESLFTHASVISAFYGWIFALAIEVIEWLIRTGISSQTAKKLVLETIEGMAAISLTQENCDLNDMLRTLATPRGITELGLNKLNEKKAIASWNDALEAVLKHLSS
jgi:pyrroline-5-carboxylate reductase